VGPDGDGSRRLGEDGQGGHRAGDAVTDTLVHAGPPPPAPDDYGIHDVPAVLPSGEDGGRRRRRRRPWRRSDGGTRVLALDGLRGVAVLAVIAFHEGVLGGGFLGVDIFFVLSGFLITGLLLPGRSSSRGRAGGLAAFWARRVRRLLPAMILLLLTIQVWLRVAAPASQWRLVNGQTQAALAYVGNWYAVVARSGYWEAGAEQTPLLHLWSLAVEEQFYLAWPLVVSVMLALGRGRVRRWMTALTLGLAVVSLAATPLIYRLYGQDRAYYGTDTRVGVILLGAALAFHRNQHAAVATTGPARRGSGLVLAICTPCPVLRGVGRHRSGHHSAHRQHHPEPSWHRGANAPAGRTRLDR
jgi:peptidoglycan/LPS O-acetylase OafA/YrhL